MKSALAISIIILLTTNSYGQILDTTKFWGNYSIVTTTKLHEKDRCTKVDTGIVWHACNNYHGEDIELTFYDINVELCDSLKLIKNSEDKKLRIYQEKKKIEYEDRRIVRLIPDSYHLNKLYYSPEILFHIQIGHRNYEFISIDQLYNIGREEINKGIFIKERIPNALNHFGIEKILVTANTNEEIIEPYSKKENQFYLKGQYSEKQELEFIKVTISNNCNDILTMTFNIN